MGAQVNKEKIQISTRVVGKTFHAHEQFIKKLEHRGAKVVISGDKGVIIVFCPIVSRFMTDVQSALSDVSGFEKIILVAMHCTYDPNYTLPDYRHIDNHNNVKVVECLFFEKTGLLECLCNDRALDMVRDELKVSRKERSDKKSNKKIKTKATGF